MRCAARGVSALLIVACLFAPIGCDRSGARSGEAKRKGGQVMDKRTVEKIALRSSAFEEGQAIPMRYTGDGQDVSPPLSWGELPEGTAAVALIVDDPDAPTPKPWVHWVIYNIPAGATGLPEASPATPELAEPQGAVQGRNTWDTIGYKGPAPPKGHGVHHYHFKIYALDQPVMTEPGATKDELLDRMSGNIIGQGELTGTYQR